MPVTDFTINNKCSNCGACCGDILPLTKEDINLIKRYVKKHNIKPQKILIPFSTTNNYFLTCPFRDEKLKKCSIYPARPWICRQFRCDKLPEDLGKPPKGAMAVSLKYVIYGDSCNQDPITKMTQGDPYARFILSHLFE